MKKIHLTILLMLLVSSVYAQTNDKQELAKLNQSLVDAYQKQDFKDATKFAEQALELSLKSFGINSGETATAYTNLGIIYQSREKYSDSIENLEKALEIYITLPQSKELANTYKVLATSYFYDANVSEAEKYYLKSIEVLENLFGEENKETFLPTLSLAKIYASEKNYEKSDEYYLKSYSIGAKNFGKDSDQVDQISDTRTCAMIDRSFKDKIDNDKTFGERRREILGIEKKDSEIVNGKAKSLPKPEYPGGSILRLRGSVAIKVIIDEEGKVSEARAICGNPILAAAALGSAKKAKFETTLRDGKPVEVEGVIIYKFNY